MHASMVGRAIVAMVVAGFVLAASAQPAAARFSFEPSNGSPVDGGGTAFSLTAAELNGDGRRSVGLPGRAGERQRRR